MATSLQAAQMAVHCALCTVNITNMLLLWFDIRTSNSFILTNAIEMFY